MSVIKVDTKEFEDALMKARFRDEDVTDILVAGTWPVITTQKMLCPVDTGATRSSIRAHFEEGGNVRSVKIGPETEYAPYIEYGTENPNYPVQPFVVPSGMGRTKKNAIRNVLLKTKIKLQQKGLL